MSFSKQKKTLFQENKYNPPPGYYDTTLSKVKPSYNTHSFPKEQRFVEKQTLVTPGPGAFYNDSKEKVKKRILQQSKLAQKNFQPQAHSNIKISSIPSIPKKSATRVYQQLAPGILILHQQQYQNTNVGPGSYNTNIDSIKKKNIAHKINPQHKKKFIDPIQQVDPSNLKEIQLQEQIRQQRRLMYQRGIIKSSAIQRNMISPADLCLQVIILRQRLLRGQQVPPPGYYYNPSVNTSFKPIDEDRPQELQLLAGRQQRFKDQSKYNIDVGPGSYDPTKNIEIKAGGFIPKQDRIIHDAKTQFRPGPGAYKIIGIESIKEQPKGNYPPIFGSGASRFPSAPKSLNIDAPGPGSYKIGGKKKKKQKYIKIKKDHIQTKIDDGKKSFLDKNQGYLNQYKTQISYSQAKKNKNTSSFLSKVERFGRQKFNCSQGTDQIYDVDQSSVLKGSFNKQKGYFLGGRDARFDSTKLRPKIGPGSYDLNLDPVRQRKIHNIVLI